jgi:hypothetical protein
LLRDVGTTAHCRTTFQGHTKILAQTAARATSLAMLAESDTPWTIA